MFFFVGLFVLVLSGSLPPFLIQLEFNLIMSTLSLTLLFDALSVMFGAVLGLVSLNAYLYSLVYLGRETRPFFFGLGYFIFSMYLLIVSADLLSVFIAWDGLGVSSVVLVFYYDKSSSASATLITFFTNRLGDVALLIGCAYALSLSYGTMSGTHYVCGMLFVLAAITKSAQWPFISWLPSAMSAPTPISALVHSSTLVTAGVYLLLRAEPAWSAGWVYVSIVTISLASAGACVTYDIKRLVAYSTMSHISMMCACLFSGLSGVASFHLVNHALLKSLLFLTAGNIILSASSQDMRRMGMPFWTQPCTALGFLVALAGMSGAMATIGSSKASCVAGVSKSAGVMMSIILMLSAWYCVRACKCLFSGSSAPNSPVETTSLYMVTVLIVGLLINTGSVTFSMASPWEASWLICGGLAASSYSLNSTTDWNLLTHLGGIRLLSQNFSNFMSGIVFSVLDKESSFMESACPRGVTVGTKILSSKFHLEWLLG